MLLGNKKNQEFSKVRGLLGRSERSLSLAAPKGMQLDFVIAPLSRWQPLRGAALRATLYAKVHLEMFLLLLPLPRPSGFPFPLSALFPFPPLQCIPTPFFCDWPSPMLIMLMRAPAESKWGLCSLCSSPSHTCTPNQTLGQLLPPGVAGVLRKPHTKT